MARYCFQVHATVTKFGCVCEGMGGFLSDHYPSFIRRSRLFCFCILLNKYLTHSAWDPVYVSLQVLLYLKGLKWSGLKRNGCFRLPLHPYKLRDSEQVLSQLLPSFLSVGMVAAHYSLKTVGTNEFTVTVKSLLQSKYLNSKVKQISFSLFGK